MDDFLNLLLHLVVTSIIFIDAQLNAYQMDEFMNGCIISMKSGWCQLMLQMMILTNLQFYLEWQCYISTGNYCRRLVGGH